MISKIKWFLLILPALVMMRCDDDNTPALNRDFELREDQLITIQSEQQDDYVEVTVLEILESRCSADASCIRHGEAEVKVSVSGLEEIAKTLDLCIGDCFQRNQGFIEVDTVEVELDHKPYAVILSDVTPYPSYATRNDPKAAVLKVIKLN